MPKYYAVRIGRSPGIYLKWQECQQQTNGFSNAKFKSFTRRIDAESYLKGGQTQSKSTKTRVSIKDKKALKSKELIEKIENIKKTHPQWTVAYTDGASKNNGHSNATAGIGVYFSDNDDRNICAPFLDPPLTNQRSELKAIDRAIETVYCSNESLCKDHYLVIVTDSMYSIDVLTRYRYKWQSNGWKTVSGEQVKNIDIIRPIIDKLDKFNVKFLHSPGHSLVYGNQMADQFADQGARQELKTNIV
jgi:ribonuclease HI